MASALNARITLSGADEIARSLQQVGQAGQDAARKIGDSFRGIGDVSAPTASIKRSIDDVGVAGQKAFKAVGDAARQNLQQVANASKIKIEAPTQGPQQQVNSFGQVVKDVFAQVSKAADGVKSAFSEIGDSIKGAASQATGFKSAIIGVGVVGGTIALIRSAYKQASDAVTDFKAAQDRASALGTSLENYQRLTFVLRSLGLSAEDAQKALDSVKPQTKITQNPGGAKIIQLPGSFPDINSLKAVQEELKGIDDEKQKLSVATKFFNGDDAAAKALLASLKEDHLAIDSLIEDFSRLRQITTHPFIDVEGKEGIKKQLDDLDKLQKQIALLGKDAGPEGESAREDVAERIQKIIGAFGGRTDLAEKLGEALNAGKTEEFFAQLQKIGAAEEAIGRGQGLTQLVNRIRQVGSGADNLSQIEKEAQQVAIATKAFGGDEIQAGAFVNAVNSGREAISAYLTKLQQLPQATRGAATVADDFSRAQKNLSQALLEVGFASRQGKTGLGLLFAPALTPVINGIADGVRKYRGEIADLTNSLSGSARDAVNDFFALLTGNKGEIQTDWIKTLSDGLSAIGTVISSVVLPAFQGLKTVVSTAAAAMNEAFGANISPAVLAVAAALIPLVGGWKAIGVAALAAVGYFATTGDSAEKLRATLSGMGIDLDKVKGQLAPFGSAIKNAFASLSGAGTNASFGEILKSSLTGIPGIILGVVAAIFALRSAANLIAPVLGRALGFGKLTGDATIFTVALGQITGVLPTIEGLLGGVAAAATATFFAMRSLALLTSWPLGMAAAIATLLLNLDIAKSAFAGLASIINGVFGSDLSGIELLAGTIGFFAIRLANVASGGLLAATAIGILKASIEDLNKVLAGSLIFRFASALLLAAGIAVVPTNKESGLGIDQEKQLDEVTQRFQQGKITQEQYAKELLELQKNFDKTGDSGKSAGQKIIDQWESIKKLIDDVSKGTATTGPLSKSVSPPSPPGVHFAPDFSQQAPAKTPAGVHFAPDFSQQVSAPVRPGVHFAPDFGEASQAVDKLKQSSDAAAASIASLNANVSQTGAAAQSAQDHINSAFDGLDTKAAAGAVSTDQLKVQVDGTGTELQSLQGPINQAFDALDGRVDSSASKLEDLKAKLQEYISLLQSANGPGVGQGASGGGGSGFAGGGLITGPGGPTSDQIPAMLSNGEFVVTAAAAKAFGADRLQALNEGKLPRFASGGSVGSFFTASASAAPIGQLTTVAQTFRSGVDKFGNQITELGEVIKTTISGQRGSAGRSGRGGDNATQSDEGGRTTYETDPRTGLTKVSASRPIFEGDQLSPLIDLLGRVTHGPPPPPRAPGGLLDPEDPNFPRPPATLGRRGGQRADLSDPSTLFAGLKDAIDPIATQFADLGKSVQGLISGTASAGEGLVSTGEKAQDTSQAAQDTTSGFDQLKAVAQQLAQVFGQDAQSAQQAAGGGLITGPGTATSDSIPARLSAGEYVVRAAAVRHIGVPALHAINSMRHFALGGLVERFASASPSMASFADGGLAGSVSSSIGDGGAGDMHNAHIYFGQRRVGGGRAEAGVVTALQRAAMLDRVSSLGSMAA